MDSFEFIEQKGWINVLDHGVKGDGVCPVDDTLQDLICAAPEDSVLYFPKGKYLFTKGVTICKRLTLRGDSFISSNFPQQGVTGVTSFIVMETPNITLFKVRGVKHCIQNISFYSDSYTMDTDHEKPAEGEIKLHHKPIINYQAVSAIECENVKDGEGYYENLFIWGFSGTAIKMPDHSLANDITIFKCGCGIKAGAYTTISNSKIWGSGYGMEISTGTLINNMRVEEVSYNAIKITGTGSNFLTNITVDQCGECGIKFDQIKHVYISGNISRCGQIFYGISYDEYLKLDDTQKNGAGNSIFYGNKMEECNITLGNGNKDLWEDIKNDDKTSVKTDIPHETYMIVAKETNNIFLSCNVDSNGLIILSKGTLTLNNGRLTSRFYDGKVCSVDGVGISKEGNDNMIKVSDGALYLNHNGDYVKTYEPQLNDVIISGNKDFHSFTQQFGGTWENLGTVSMNSSQTVNYYKKLSDPM